MKISKIDKKLDELGIDTFNLSQTFYLSTTISRDIVDDMSSLASEILESKESRDYSQYLAGEIQDGQQVEISSNKLKDLRAVDFIETIESLSSLFVERYFSLLRLKHSPSFTCEINDMWIVSQLAGDFNPPHRHLIRSNCGLSGVIYLKIPDQICEERKDGCFQFIWGPESRFDISRFSLPNIESITPTPGQIILFPHSLTHQAFPFRGVGERICVPFNVNVWPSHGEQWRI